MLESWLRIIKGIWKSFQTHRTFSTKMVMVMGLISGTTTRQYAPKVVQPSIEAASSKSAGTERM